MVLSNEILKVIASFASGTITGMGLGGGMILIPILIMLDIPQKEAQVINLMCYIPISLIISLINAKKEFVNRNLFLTYAVIGGIIGALLAINLKVGILKSALGIIMIIIGIMEIKKCMKKDL